MILLFLKIRTEIRHIEIKEVVMAKSITLEKDHSAIIRRTKEGGIRKRSDSERISIEKKDYTLSELSGLMGKFKKIETPLSVDEEKNNGKSIMINIRTLIFELLKLHIFDLLKRMVLL